MKKKILHTPDTVRSVRIYRGILYVLRAFCGGMDDLLLCAVVWCRDEAATEPETKLGSCVGIRGKSILRTRKRNSVQGGNYHGHQLPSGQ